VDHNEQARGVPPLPVRYPSDYPKDEIKNIDDTLYVIAVVSNPVRFKSRYRLFREFAARMYATPGVQLVIVEHAFGARPFEVTEANNPFHVQVRGAENHELWLKESLVNVGVRRLPPDWKYMAWIDADVEFVRPNWVSETIHALQHYSVIQPWSHSVDLTPDYDVADNEWGNAVDKSFCAAWVDGDFIDIDQDYGTNNPVGQRGGLAGSGKRAARSHFGYAWAIRREAFDAIGGLIDWLVTGSGDYHMALAFGGLPWPKDASAGYVRRLEVFSKRCEQHIRQNIGYVPGLILHHWHGRKKQRGYISRHSIIHASKFDPDLDLQLDWQGIPVLTGNNLILRDGLRQYFRARNEDSVDTR
jgi:hypothetical protein